MIYLIIAILGEAISVHPELVEAYNTFAKLVDAALFSFISK